MLTNMVEGAVVDAMDIIVDNIIEVMVAVDIQVAFAIISIKVVKDEGVDMVELHLLL